MKKFRSIVGLFVIVAMAALLPKQSEAQVTSLISTTNGGVKDTVTNTGVKRLTLPVKGYKATITIQVDVTKQTGALGGTIIPIASNDGVTWYVAGSGTFSVTDVASQGTLFSPPLGFAYYGIQWTGTGTMAGTVVAKLLGRKTTD